MTTGRNQRAALVRRSLRVAGALDSDGLGVGVGLDADLQLLIALQRAVILDADESARRASTTDAARNEVGSATLAPVELPDAMK
jgi:hypothetical protein